MTLDLPVGSAWGTWEDALENDPWLGGRELVRPGIGDIPHPIRLCTGAVDTCPTRPEQVAEGMIHECEGVFGRQRRFQGSEIFWLACTRIYRHPDRAVTDAALAGVPRSVVLGTHPDQMPVLTADDLRYIKDRNAAYVARADRSKAPSIHHLGAVFLIGANPNGNIYRYLVANTSQHGTVFVFDGADGAVVIGFSDVHTAWRDFVRATVADSSSGVRVAFCTSADKGHPDRLEHGFKLDPSGRENIKQQNAVNVAQVDRSAALPYLLLGSVFFMGPGHDRKALSKIGSGDYHKDRLRVIDEDDGTVAIVPPPEQEWFSILAKTVSYVVRRRRCL
ncbi:hypothetical protein ACFQ78_33835 [Streptomyces sp. NPDC056519]|uniref:hypothetical protein n=1 Tax=Streptomyces sp. NPDC056519 TaxID=3345849 RepID=UPI0036984F01